MKNEMTIEQAQAQLEDMIKQMENEALPLHESVELYGKACELLAFCMETLDGYRGRIEEIDKVLAAYQTEDTDEQ